MTTERIVDVGALIERKTLAPLQLAVVLWMCGLMVLEGFDMQAMAFAAPAIIREWGVSKAAFGPVLSSGLVGYMLGALTLSMMGDTLGRKKVIIVGTFLFGVFTLATVFAASLTMLMVLRFLAGIGLGSAIPTGIALVAEYVPPRRRATMIGLMFVGYTIGSALGGFLAAATISTYGWQAVFFAGGVAPLPLCLGLALCLPESVHFLAMRKSEAARLAAIVRRLDPDEEAKGPARYIVHEEIREASPLASLFAKGRAVMTCLLWFAFVASFVGHYFLVSWLPTVLSDAGLRIDQANFVSALFQVGGAVGSYLVGRLLDYGGMRVVVVTFLLAALFVAPLGVLAGAGTGIVLGGMIFIAGLSVLGGQIGLNATAGTIYPSAMRSTGVGWAMGIGRIGSISGPIIGGILITAGFSHQTLFLLAAIPLVACAVALLALMSNRRRSPERDTVPAAGEFAH